ncbi:hypothetical protein IW138_003958 [Coemansia sp. RSA 986]|nr:hypothetical protein IW138_003958 [Coemansia sp. RSA 986]
MVLTSGELVRIEPSASKTTWPSGLPVRIIDVGKDVDDKEEEEVPAAAATALFSEVPKDGKEAEDDRMGEELGVLSLLLLRYSTA